jgi:exonuclease III
MTWNIWHGGLHGQPEDNFEKDTLNTLNILKVLQQEKPDVLFMQETYCCGMEIAKAAGFKYSWRGSANLSIHSNYPILDTINIYKPFNSHAVTINYKGKEILLVNIWLHYLPSYFEDIKVRSADSLISGESNTRLSEISAILSSIDRLQKEVKLPVIIGGDFNSGSHLDWIESTKNFHYNKVVQWPVSKLVIDHGYSDSYRVVNTDPLLTLDGTYGFLFDGIISDRIDYIYFKGENIKVVNSKIVKNDPKNGFFNSDHRAILTNFSFE